MPAVHPDNAILHSLRCGIYELVISIVLIKLHALKTLDTEKTMTIVTPLMYPSLSQCKYNEKEKKIHLTLGEEGCV